MALGTKTAFASARIDTTTKIYLARACRDFGDGFVAVLLPVYLVAIGVGAFGVGVVASLALLGSALTTLGIGYLGARTDHRRLLMISSVIMVVTGLAFATTSTFALILLIAFIGTINPSAGTVSIFVPLEHTVLSGSVADADRTRMFARYRLIGSLAAAVGSLAAGSIELLGVVGLSKLGALRGMFVLYAVLGLLGGLLYAGIPPDPPQHETKPTSALGPSRIVVYKLADGGVSGQRLLGWEDADVGRHGLGLMLEPGARISHAAVALAARAGTLIVWVGEAGVRLYAAGHPGGARSDRLLWQAKLALNEELRLKVVRRMFEQRFGEVAPGA